jgi:hypothetical protein
MCWLRFMQVVRQEFSFVVLFYSLALLLYLQLVCFDLFAVVYIAEFFCLLILLVGFVPN